MPSWLETAAPFLFQMSEDRTHIELPPAVDQIIIDVGARRSVGLAMLRQPSHANASLFMFEPSFDAFAPLQLESMRIASVESRFGKYDKAQGELLGVRAQRRAFAIQAAVSDSEHMTMLRLAHQRSAACSSILRTHAKLLPCVKTRALVPVPVIRLDSLLKLLPTRLKWTVLKVDAEGNDMAVLRGAGPLLSQFNGVIIECQNLPSGQDKRMLHTGGCVVKEATAFMCQQHGFCEHRFVPQSASTGKSVRIQLGNVYFGKTQTALTDCMRSGITEEATRGYFRLQHA